MLRPRPRHALRLALILLLAASAGVSRTVPQLAAAAAPPLERVSIPSAGGEANGSSGHPSTSADGRLVAFESAATNLVAGDTNRKVDVFVHDRQTGETTRVSVSSTGAEADGDSAAPVISADGRFVAFTSKATNLVPGDTNRKVDVFVHDRQTGETTRVSVSSTGAEADGDSATPAISGDGHAVAFASKATNLVPGDTNRKQDIFVHDRDRGETTRVSVSSAGTEADGDSATPAISGDGHVVAFASKATNLVPGDTNRKQDVFVHDRDTGETTLVSLSTAGAASDEDAEAPSISGEGRFVAFVSKAAALSPDDANRKLDVFLHDRDTGETIRASAAGDGADERRDSEQPSISADGNALAFVSVASNLVPGDTNRKADVFVLQRNHAPLALPDLVRIDRDATVEIAVLANDSDPDGDPLAVIAFTAPEHGSVSFSGAVATYTPDAGFGGTDTFTYAVSDGRGGPVAATVTVMVNRAPAVTAGAASTTITLPAAASLTGTVTDDGLPVDPGTVTTAWSQVSGPGIVAFADASAVDTTASFPEAGSYVLRLSAFDGRLTGTADVLLTVNAAGEARLPPDPAAVAPALARNTVTTLGGATEFLYTGPNPIQTGVTPGTIHPVRAAVLRGRVLDRASAPLPGVTITILDHPEFGQTLSRADGMFDLAVNGGGRLTVNYDKPGFLPAQRQVNAPWQDYAFADDVVLIEPDPNLTVVDLTDASRDFHVARGSVVTDADGQRQATLLIPAGTQASVYNPDGTTRPVTTLTLRLTEYTVGANGPQAMPAPLPAASAYTYAVEVTAEEASVRIGGADVVFDRPVPFYVDNFLEFPVGTIVPVGDYDSAQATWIPSPDGLVIKVLGVAGGRADLDTDGDGVADSSTTLAGVGIQDTERFQIASLYPVGHTLWRVPVTHLSTKDLNSPLAPLDAVPPMNSVQPPEAAGKTDTPITVCGSIIECENQTLREVISLTGTGLTLNYASDRVRGRSSANTLHIPLAGAQVPPSVLRIDLVIEVAGRRFEHSFPPQPNQEFVFQWDGLDAYGRRVIGVQPGSVGIAHVYRPLYGTPAQRAASFGRFAATSVPLTVTRDEVKVWQRYRVHLGIGVGAQPVAGWSLSAHHQYDPVGRVLYRGDGSRLSASGAGLDVITTIAGRDPSGFGGDGGLATAARLDSPHGLAVGPDGSLYIADRDSRRIRRVDPFGIISTVAGTGANGFSGDGGLATQAALSSPVDVAVGPDGSLYIADTGNQRIRKVSVDGIITTVAGNGQEAFGGDGGPATQASLDGPEGVAIGPDGSIYIADTDNWRVRRVSPDGIITTVAGSGERTSDGDGLPAGRAAMGPVAIDIDTEGNLFIVDISGHRVRKVSPRGIITTVAGDGSRTFRDGQPATQSGVWTPRDVALGRDGSFYITVRTTSPAERAVFKVSPGGTISLVAGGAGATRFNFAEGVPATQADAGGPQGVVVAPDGNVYISDERSRVRKIASALPGFAATDIAIPSEDGSLLYRFERAGRHLATINALTGATLLSFGYDARGDLVTVTDGDGLVTTIERDAAGHPTAIVAPFGQRTQLALDANDYLAAVTNPAGDTIAASYTAGGLLTSFRDPRGNASTFTYDALGRLVRDENAASGHLALDRADQSDGHAVAVSTALGRVTAHGLRDLPTGDRERSHTFADGTTWTTVERRDAGRVSTAPDGTVTTLVQGPDPRFSMTAPIPQSLTIATGGLTATLSSQRTVNLADASNPLSLTTLTDSVTVNGRTSSSVYTAATRTFTSTSAAGRQATAVTDAQGRVTQAQVPGLLPVNTTYDAQGRVATITQGTGADARTVTFAYNAEGHLDTVTDPLDRTVSYAYDAAGRVTRQTLPDAREILFGYDAAGNLTSLTPPGRPAHVLHYNAVNRVSEYVPPDVGAGTNSTVYGYDLDQAVTSIARPDGQTVTPDHDSAGRLQTLGVDGQPLRRYTYSQTTGKVTSVATGAGDALAFTYSGALLTQSAWTGAVSGTVGYAYDTDFRIRTFTVNGANPITFTYDADSLLTAAGALTLTRSPQNGLLTGTTLGSVTDSYTYNGFGEVTDYTARVSGTPVFSTQFTRDALGRITRKVETISGTTDTFDYAYDAAGRLAEVKKNGVTTATYGYDANGNRTHVNGALVARYDDQDRLLEYDGATYTYTANGELATKTVGSAVTTYQYDVLGNLIRVVLPDGTQIDYVIDGRNRRVGKKVNGVLVQGFLYQDQLRPVAELDGTGAVVSRFVYTSRFSAPDYLITGGVTYRLILDHLGGPRLVVNPATGTVVRQVDYDDHGMVVESAGHLVLPFGFAGGLYDSDIGLVRFGARDYDPRVARWASTDPIRFAGGSTNLYSYASNDSVNRKDSSGLQVDRNIVGPDPFMKLRTGRNLTQRDVGNLLPDPPGYCTIFAHGDKLRTYNTEQRFDALVSRCQPTDTIRLYACNIAGPMGSLLQSHADRTGRSIEAVDGYFVATVGDDGALQGTRVDSSPLEPLNPGWVRFTPNQPATPIPKPPDLP